MESCTLTTLVYTLQVIICTGAIFIGGLSSCLSLWVVPLTAQLPPKLLCKQFAQMFTWGEQYLLPSSRLLGGSFLITTILTSQLPRTSDAEIWKTWAVLFCALFTIAPYEIYLIFPINDRVKEIGQEMEKGMGRDAEQKKELQELLLKWQFRNFGRVLTPAIVGLIAMMNLVKR
ncbi:hypothetical protein HBH64_119910 [Parastagonospora nodorum]|nr:hypothetical protein HBH51_107120 [Parastagonospora nodorum]KAH4298290.1 hypothetical protein HBI01_129300 [Parastagonospora nodorum]KAH4318274.1 hypothetical protein HBI02_015380 [Parastagonospora nodorum]KAH4326796.1 hypothetical protein HBI00_131880 [Parastagonospora nodorum]KAH4393436.1 hypothetical protein HBH94_012170 [Parastagonospora nodorum]